MNKSGNLISDGKGEMLKERDSLWSFINYWRGLTVQRKACNKVTFNVFSIISGSFAALVIAELILRSVHVKK